MACCIILQFTSPHPLDHLCKTHLHVIAKILHDTAISPIRKSQSSNSDVVASFVELQYDLGCCNPHPNFRHRCILYCHVCALADVLHIDGRSITSRFSRAYYCSLTYIIVLLLQRHHVEDNYWYLVGDRRHSVCIVLYVQLMAIFVESRRVH